MKKNDVLNRRLFRHKAQIATKQVPGHNVGAFKTIYEVGKRVLPKAVGPIKRLGKKGIDAFAQRFPKTAQGIKKTANVTGQGLEVAGTGYTGMELGKAGLNVTSGMEKLMTGDIEGGKKSVEEAGSNLLNAGIGLPFAKKGFDVISNVTNKVSPNLDVAKGLGSLTEKATPNLVKKYPFLSSLGFLGGSLAYDTVRAEDTPEEQTSANQILSEPVNPDNIIKAGLDNNDNAEDNPEPEEQTDPIFKENLKKEVKELEKDKTQNFQAGDNLQNIVRGNLAEDIVETAVETEKQKETSTNNRPSATDASTAAESLITNSSNLLPGANKLQNDIVDIEDPKIVSILLSQTRSDFSAAKELVDDYEKKVLARDAEKRQSFDEYKKMYEDMTGDVTTNFRDYALLKWAGRMMSGKSYDGGLFGAMEILGESTIPLADDLAVIDEYEKNRIDAIATNYLELEKNLDEQIAADEKEVFSNRLGLITEELKQDITSKEEVKNRALLLYNSINEMQNALSVARIKAENERNKNLYKVGDPELYQLTNPQAIALTELLNKAGIKANYGPSWSGTQPIKVYTNTENANLQYIRAGNNQLIPIPPEVDLSLLTPADFDLKLQDDALSQLSASNTLMKLTNQFAAITQAKDGLDKIGLSGAVKIFLENLKDTGRQLPLVGSKVENTFPAVSSLLDDTNAIVNPNVGGFTEGGTLTEDDAKHLGQVQSEFLPKGTKDVNGEEIGGGYEIYEKAYRQEIKRARNKKTLENLARAQGYGTSDDELKDLSTLLVIQARAKYLIARMNKEKDRISNYDMKAAEQRTNIFGLFGSRTVTVENYAALNREASGIFEGKAKIYERYGGDPRQLANIFAGNQVIERKKGALKLQLNTPTVEEATKNLEGFNE